MDLNGKRVLVTGADGFIGSHLTQMLLHQGARVRALALYNSFNSWGWLEEIDEIGRVEVVTGDVRDSHACLKLTQGIEVVFHLAALVGIPYSYLAPDSYIQTNVTGTWNMIQAARESGVGRFLHVSSSEVYGTACFVPIHEDHPLQPQSPYSATKIAAEAMALSAHRAFGVPVVVARPFNAYGPRQSLRAVIPTIISQVLAGARSIRLGHLHPTRDFSYVEDTARGLLSLALCDAAIGKAVNIGSHSEISIGDLAGRIQKLMNSDLAVESDAERVRPEASEVERLFCDNTRIREMTGYQPRVSIDEGLERTIAWFREERNLNRCKASLYNV
jgi:NAD dependent epimerase/dehydratase